LEKGQAMDRYRVWSFSKDCDRCQEGDPKDTCTLGDVLENESHGDVAPSTPAYLVMDNPVGVSPDHQG
jgi:hypothetical protein